MSSRSIANEIRRAIAWRKMRKSIAQERPPPAKFKPLPNGSRSLALKIIGGLAAVLSIILLAQMGVLGQVVEIIKAVF